MDLLNFFEASVGKPTASITAAETEERLHGEGSKKKKSGPKGPLGGQSPNPVEQEPAVQDRPPVQAEEVDHHPRVAKDIQALDPKQRKKAKTLVTVLASGQRHTTTHPLTGLKGWESTHVDPRTLIIHQQRPEGLYIGYIGGQHNYGAAHRRLGSLDILSHFKEAGQSAEHYFGDDYRGNPNISLNDIAHDLNLHPYSGASPRADQRVSPYGEKVTIQPHEKVHVNQPTVFTRGVHQYQEEEGSRSPIQVTKDPDSGDYEVLEGHHRLVSDRLAGKPTDAVMAKTASSGVDYRVEYPRDHEGEGHSVASIDGKDVGRLRWDIHSETPTVIDMSVDEEHRRKGIGTGLFEKAREHESGLQHSDVLTDDGRAFKTAEKAPDWKEDHAWLPHDRIFSGGKGGVDPRLFDTKTRIMHPAVKKTVMDAISGLWSKYDANWGRWARVYLAGSEASEWWGNNDFDCLIGIDHDRARQRVLDWAGLTDDAIDTMLTNELRENLNNEDYIAPWDGEVWHQTFFVNPNSWDIRKIKPYAAYDITRDIWAVDPVKADKDWGPTKLPEALFSEGEGLVKQIDAIERLPDTQRTGRGAALWDYLHNDRRRAFSDDGEGVFDTGNAVWKYLDMNPTEPLTRLLKMKREHLQKKRIEEAA